MIQQLATNFTLSVMIITDFEAICDQDIPPPWEEEHGLYAMIVSILLYF